MGKITYDPYVRRFSGQSSGKNVADTVEGIGRNVADTVEGIGRNVADTVEGTVTDVGTNVAKRGKKVKRSLGELLKDTFVSPKTKADRLRRRTAISALMSTASLALSAKNHIDKNNMRKYDADVKAWNNALYEYHAGKRKKLPKPPDIPKGIDATIDYWKTRYNEGKGYVKNLFASDTHTEDGEMSELSKEYREASKEETGRMKKALNDMADRCRAKSVGFTET